MKKKFLLIFFICIFAIISVYILNAKILKANEAGLQTADELYSKGRYQKAIDEYEKIFKARSGSNKWKAFYRICDSLGKLSRFGEAAQKLYEIELPADKNDKARLLMLKAEVFQRFHSMYSQIVRREKLVEETADTDVFRLSADEIEKISADAYKQIWDLRAELVNLKLEDENYFIECKNADFGMYPTLFDFYVYRWTEYLFSKYSISEKFKEFSAERFLGDDFNIELDTNDTGAYLACGLVHFAEKYEKNKRLEAAERWKIKRILMPLERNIISISDYFAFSNETIKTLLKQADTFKTINACAEALFEAAEINNNIGDFKNAVNICKTIISKYRKSIFIQKAEILKTEIETPILSINTQDILANTSANVPVSVRNLKKVFFRIYKIDPQQYKKEYMDYNSKIYRNREFNGWSNLFHETYSEWFVAFSKNIIDNGRVLKEWTEQTGDTGFHYHLNKNYSTPILSAGIYVIFCSENSSFNIGSSIVNSCIVNASDLMLFCSTGLPISAEKSYNEYIETQKDKIIDENVFHLYTVNAKTGKPEQNTKINIIANSHKKNYFTLDKVSGDDGISGIRNEIKINEYNYLNIDPLAEKNNSYAFWNNKGYFNASWDNPLKVFVETDRPIYRPGQKVNFKVVVIKKNKSGFQAGGNSKKILITAKDVNYQEFFRKELTLGEFGSAAGEFEIPAGRLLGRYVIEVNYSDGRFSENTAEYISIEEYKRPEFEVKIDDADKPWKFGEPVEIKGSVNYYFGGAAANAKINYKIKRGYYIPWFYRSWIESYNDNYLNEITSGDIVSDKEGKFRIDFTPVSDNTNYYYFPNINRFEIEINARDAGGRTISANKTFRAGKTGLMFMLEKSKGFYFNNENILIKSSRLTVNETPAPGKSYYEIFEIPDTAVCEEYYNHNYFGWNRPVEVQINNIKNGRLIKSGELEHDKSGIAQILLKNLDAGTYRLVQKNYSGENFDDTQAIVFIVADKNSKRINAPVSSVTIPERGEYSVGEKAAVILGSQSGSGIFYIELWAGKYLLKKETVMTDDPVYLFEFPVVQEMKGGFSIRWFSVKNNKVFNGSASISVPYTEKKLNIEFSKFNKKELEPGEETEYNLKINDSENNPAIAEALAFMYDRSLEYYASSNSQWLDSLYGMRSSYVQFNDSRRYPGVRSFNITEGLLSRLMKSFEKEIYFDIPAVRFSYMYGRTRTRGGGYSGIKYNKSKSIDNLRMKNSESEDMDYSALSPVPACEAIAMDSISDKKELNSVVSDITTEKFSLEKKTLKVEIPDFSTVKTRSAFSDAAFFQPFLKTDSAGNLKFSFKAPEQLTSWKMKVFAFTKDVKHSLLTSEIQTRKILMTRIDIPRFFREKDKGTINGIVHNESNEKLEGKIKLTITCDSEDITEKLGVTENIKSFSIDPKSMQNFDWILDIPAGIGTYKVNVAAVSGKYSDAEERELPIFPSRERLIETIVSSLNGADQKVLEIKLKDDSTRISESASLQIEPQLALSLLNTIPFLIQYPYECVEQTLNKYVPLAIVNEMYSKYPALKSAVSKVPKRDSITPPWEQDDPRRLTTLMETPWVYESEGGNKSANLIDLLDPKTVKKQKDKAYNKLKNAQLGDGSFPWWEGGKSDLYMTLYILDAFAQARRFGVEVDHDMLDNALEYVNNRIPYILKAEEYYLSLVCYSAYILTSYPQSEFSGAKKGFRAAKSWVVFLEKNIDKLTPMGKAYLAYTHLRLGDRKKAEEIFDMAMDGWRTDPVAGIYWTPEKYSWVWYSDSVEKHAFFLKLLQELRPKDPKIGGMVQWLLFNRKGNVWKSTKASAAAVYSLLDFMNNSGSLTKSDFYEIKWADKKDAFEIKPDDFLQKPIRLTVKDEQVTDEHRTASIKKTGPGICFASLTYIYSTDELPETSQDGMINLSRKFYVREKSDNGYILRQIKSGDTVKNGAEIEVQLKINTKSRFEYMHLKDPKAAGFEAVSLTSGWKWDYFGHYEEQRDSLTNFFFDNLPHGEYIFKYYLRPTKPGVYRVGAAVIQSMYSPDMSAHSSGFIIKVE